MCGVSGDLCNRGISNWDGEGLLSGRKKGFSFTGLSLQMGVEIRERVPELKKTLKDAAQYIIFS